jgi:hypothetical protein
MTRLPQALGAPSRIALGIAKVPSGAIGLGRSGSSGR